jgi:hypothetical protein
MAFQVTELRNGICSLGNFSPKSHFALNHTDVFEPKLLFLNSIICLMGSFFLYWNLQTWLHLYAHTDFNERAVGLVHDLPTFFLPELNSNKPQMHGNVYIFLPVFRENLNKPFLYIFCTFHTIFLITHRSGQ